MNRPRDWMTIQENMIDGVLMRLQLSDNIYNHYCLCKVHPDHHWL